MAFLAVRRLSTRWRRRISTLVLQNVDLYASYGMGSESDLLLSMLGEGTLEVDV